MVKILTGTTDPDLLNFDKENLKDFTQIKVL